MALPQYLSTFSQATRACSWCGSVHVSGTAALASLNVRSFFTGISLANWRKKHTEREAKKKIVQEYVGENSERTTTVYAWGAADSGALGKMDAVSVISCASSF